RYDEKSIGQIYEERGKEIVENRISATGTDLPHKFAHPFEELQKWQVPQLQHSRTSTLQHSNTSTLQQHQSTLINVGQGMNFSFFFVFWDSTTLSLYLIATSCAPPATGPRSETVRS